MTYTTHFECEAKKLEEKMEAQRKPIRFNCGDPPPKRQRTPLGVSLKHSKGLH